jgi:hypothetical protein
MPSFAAPGLFFMFVSPLIWSYGCVTAPLRCDFNQSPPTCLSFLICFTICFAYFFPLSFYFLCLATVDDEMQIDISIFAYLYTGEQDTKG